MTALLTLSGFKAFAERRAHYRVRNSPAHSNGCERQGMACGLRKHVTILGREMAELD